MTPMSIHMGQKWTKKKRRRWRRAGKREVGEAGRERGRHEAEAGRSQCWGSLERSREETRG